MLGKYPLLNWNEDEYADWLLTNSSSLNAQGIGAGITTLLGAGQMIAGLTIAGLGASFTGPLGLGIALGGLGTFASGGSQIASTIATDIDHSKQPNSISGLAGAGDINTASGNSSFFFYKYSIKREFAKMIDDYFSMYGYKVNSLEVPLIHTRTNWNYLKVLDPNIEGAVIPEKDMNKYKEQLKQGITFWHNSSTFRDYSQSNNVIT